MRPPWKEGIIGSEVDKVDFRFKMFLYKISPFDTID